MNVFLSTYQLWKEINSFLYPAKSFLGEDKNVEDDFEMQNFASLLCDKAEGTKVWSVGLNHWSNETLDLKPMG